MAKFKVTLSAGAIVSTSVVVEAETESYAKLEAERQLERDAFSKGIVWQVDDVMTDDIDSVKVEEVE